MKDEWRTPEYLANYCHDQIGGKPWYDTACTALNAVAPPIWDGTGGQDALSATWRGYCFCHPPHSNIEPWIAKALNSDAVTVMVLPSPNGERVYVPLFNRAYEIHIIGRIGFIDESGVAQSGNRRGTSIFVLDPARSVWVGGARRHYIERDRIIIAFGSAALPARPYIHTAAA